jgi:hypothetical protein
MRFHTSSLYAPNFRKALSTAIDKGNVAPDVYLVALSPHGSRTHTRAFELQLGAVNRNSLPAGYTDQNGKHPKVRKYKNGTPVYAATWHEHGWVLAELFRLDPDAMFGSLNGFGYKGEADFHRQTGNQFK